VNDGALTPLPRLTVLAVNLELQRPEMNARLGDAMADTMIRAQMQQARAQWKERRCEASP